MSISNGTKQGPNLQTGGAETTGSPSQDTRLTRQLVGFFVTKARRATAPRPSVTRLIWLPGPDCQQSNSRKRQKTDK